MAILRNKIRVTVDMWKDLNKFPDDIFHKALSSILRYAFYGEVAEGLSGEAEEFFAKYKPFIDSQKG